MEKTIAKVGYAMITAESSLAVTYDNSITWFASNEAGGREVKASPKGETFEIEADGIIVDGGEDNNGYDIDLTLLDVIDDIREDWLGKTAVSDGYLEIGGATSYPKFALVVAKKQYKASKEYLIDVYYSCQVSERPEKSSKTNAGKFDPEFPTYKIAARPRMDNQWVHREVFADELPTSIPVTAPSSSSSSSGSGSSGSGT